MVPPLVGWRPARSAKLGRRRRVLRLDRSDVHVGGEGLGGFLVNRRYGYLVGWWAGRMVVRLHG